MAAKKQCDIRFERSCTNQGVHRVVGLKKNDPKLYCCRADLVRRGVKLKSAQ